MPQNVIKMLSLIFHTVWKPVLTNFPTSSGTTQVDAEKLCNDAFNGDSTIQACRAKAGISFQSIIDGCVEDIKVCYNRYGCFIVDLCIDFV